jgi:hypothetical protein
LHLPIIRALGRGERNKYYRQLWPTDDLLVAL